jgi:hypothetical protein
MTPDNVLRQILAAVSTDHWQETVAPWLEAPLNDGTRVRAQYIDLQTLDTPNPKLSEPFINGPEAKVLVSSRSLPYLAILSRDANEEWRLRSFESQCPACFGTGVLGDHPDWNICLSCGGTGWGAIS